MAETVQPVSDNKKSSHGILISFLSVLLVCCALYCFAIYLHNNHIVEGQNRIIRTYALQVEKMESEKLPMNMRDSQREKEISAFHQEVKSLSELEFNRMQNEFEEIEIWTGVLTVIFLIFSFYSLFKTEQLESQSREELMRLKRIVEDGDLRLKLFDTKSETALSSLQSSADSVRNVLTDQINDVLGKNKTDALNEFNKSAKDILEAYNEELRKLIADNQKAMESKYNQYLNQFKSIVEKDMTMEEEGEDELDEEILRNDVENEDNEKEG